MREGDFVWLLVMFDLPNVTDGEKRAHTVFRNGLLRRGFTRLQWSVYARGYASEKACVPDRGALEVAVPPGGRVRMLVVTDLQFGRMVCVDGGRRREPEKKLEQIVMIE